MESDESSEYAHVDPDISSWDSCRWPRIQTEIKTAAADILCFQEVQAAMFDRDFKPWLRKEGYEGMHLQGKPEKNKDAGDRVAVATFWATDTFEFVDSCHRYRTMGVVLRHKPTGWSIAVLNVHLEGDPSAVMKRLKQLHRAMKETVSFAPHHAAIVAGDFNCLNGASATSSYLAFGAVEPGVPEWGRPCTEEVCQIPTNPYHTSSKTDGFCSVYEPTSATGTAGVWSLGEQFTYCGSPHRPVDGLDQIWATMKPLELLARRSLFQNPKHRDEILASGLPNSREPSDHLPIGAIFRWSASDKHDLREAFRAGMAEAVAASAVPETCAEIKDEIDALLLSCPFLSDDDRLEYTTLLTDPPGIPAKGKPPPEILIDLQSRRSRRNELTSHFSEEATDKLKRVTALGKALKKKNRKNASPKGVRKTADFPT